jgi:uncharacterized protein YjdB
MDSTALVSIATAQRCNNGGMETGPLAQYGSPAGDCGHSRAGSSFKISNSLYGKAALVTLGKQAQVGRSYDLSFFADRLK